MFSSVYLVLSGILRFCFSSLAAAARLLCPSFLAAQPPLRMQGHLPRPHGSGMWGGWQANLAFLRYNVNAQQS